MFDPMERVSVLAAEARREEAPVAHVSVRVTAMLAELEEEAEERRSAYYAAAISFACAVITCSVAAVWYYTWTDPVVSMLANLTWSLL